MLKNEARKWTHLGPQTFHWHRVGKGLDDDTSARIHDTDRCPSDRPRRLLTDGTGRDRVEPAQNPAIWERCREVVSRLVPDSCLKLCRHKCDEISWCLDTGDFHAMPFVSNTFVTTVTKLFEHLESDLGPPMFTVAANVCVCTFGPWCLHGQVCQGWEGRGRGGGGGGGGRPKLDPVGHVSEPAWVPKAGPDSGPKNRAGNWSGRLNQYVRPSLTGAGKWTRFWYPLCKQKWCHGYS